MSIPNTQSEKANDTIAKQFPAGDNNAKMKIIIKSKNNNEISPKIIEQAITKGSYVKNMDRKYRIRSLITSNINF